MYETGILESRNKNDAATNIFFSLYFEFGFSITLANYNNLHNDYHRSWFDAHRLSSGDSDHAKSIPLIGYVLHYFLISPGLDITVRRFISELVEVETVNIHL
ncbi:unnamed protein product [Soboliphyme baturini]|uniref:PDEase domain-containing protein n=1 Tax=Soboliphyme baturini TaxID=241478 RepID=A0A183II21_9BILA|nr:unnamed protein product [Soboliphyme baturini]